MHRNDFLPRNLGLKAVALAVLSAWSGQASAETTPAAPAGAASAALPSVEITGFRSQNTRTIANKEASAVTVDSVASDEIGRLPDFNVGDALKRVTGVSTLEYQGEPRYVIVRGLNGNYNTTLIDGFAFATTDIGSRQILMEVLPLNFVHRIDVTKTFLPENVGGSIGGTANLVTAGGFDHPDGVLTLQAKGGATLMSDRYGGHEPGGEAAAKWGTRIGPARQFAFLGSASYWRRHIHVPQIESGGSLNWYNADGTRNNTPYGGNGLAVPTERRWYNYDNDRDRAGITARLDWRPEGPVGGHVATYWFRQHENSGRATQNSQVQSSARVSNQTPTSGTLSNVNQYVEFGRLRWGRDLYGINGELTTELAPKWNADLRGSVSRAVVSNPQSWDKFQQNALAFNYDWSATAPIFSAVNPANSENPARYANVYHQEERTEYSQRVSDLQVNLHHNVDEDARGWGAALGARLVQTRMNTAFARRTWNAMPYTLADALAGSTCGFECNTPLYVVDTQRADQAWVANRDGVTPVDDVTAQNGATYGVEEEIKAAYTQAQWRSEHWLLAGGVRYEQTRFQSKGWQQVNGAWSETAAQRSYSDLLPSLTGFYATGLRSKLRFGLSRTLGRPRLDQMALKGGVLNTSASPNTLSQSNPDLKPRRSDNVDIGHDWVLGGGRSMVAVALFHKTIRDEIFRFGELQTINGVDTLVTQPRNVDGRVRITGVELGVIKELGSLVPALNGFTVSFNASALDVKYPVKLGDGTSTTLGVLPQQPKELWNLALTYENGPWHTKLAWNHTGKLWDDRFPNYDSVVQFYRNRYQEPTDKVDLQIAYDVTRNLSLSFDALNITGQGFQYKYGQSQEYLQSAWKVSPIVMVGVNVKL
ncbi:MAG TPA: TonB-dependent receptor [Albitalea sp.]|uniref:TonB-dependent receptor n=1 Tax=Piscinibacter sp. TaxID=1903157 RepID=UPI002ED41BF1